MSKYFGSKKFNFSLLNLSVPIIIQNFINSSLGFIDNLMVGQLGAAFVGGVAASNRFFAIMNSSTSSIVGTCGIFISQFNGANNDEKMKESFRISLWINYIFLIPFLIISIFFSERIIAFFMNDAQIIDIGIRYIRITQISYIPLCLSLAIASAMRSIGQTKIPMYICSLNMVIKLFLNMVLMYGWLGLPSLSIEGAAIATLVTRCVEAVLYLIVLKLNSFPFATRIHELTQISFTLVKTILIKMIPFYINDILWSFSNSLVLKCFGSRGEDNYNSYAITSTILDIFQTFNGGIVTATTVFVSQKLGSGNLNEAKKIAYWSEGFGFVMAVFFSSCMLIVPLFIPIVYSESGEQVIRISQYLIFMQSVCFVMFQMSMQNYAIFKAGGDGNSILIMDCGSVWFIMIPILFFAAYYTDVSIYQLYLIGQIGEAAKLLISIYLLRKEKWVKNLAIQNQA